MLDKDSRRCLFVIKNSLRTGVTIGRLNGVKSFIRKYHPNGDHKTSMELAISPYSCGPEADPFSERGDSRSIIVDPTGCIVGLLTGRTGLTGSTDITYATSFYWIMERIKMV